MYLVRKTIIQWETYYHPQGNVLRETIIQNETFLGKLAI